MASLASPLALVAASSLGHAGATVIMARMGAGRPAFLAALVTVALGLAALAELAALRHPSIGVVYLTILGLETVLVLAAAFWFGQALGPRELTGAARVLTGTVLLAGSQG